MVQKTNTELPLYKRRLEKLGLLSFRKIKAEKTLKSCYLNYITVGKQQIQLVM